MDAVDQTAIVKEDALKKVDGETNVCDGAGLKTALFSACVGGAGDLKSCDTDGIVTVEKQAGAATDFETSDDLLEKIEEVVKTGPNGNEIVDSVIAQSSEQDFLKKLEEIETESRPEDKAEHKTNEENTKIVEECVTSSDEKEEIHAPALAESDVADSSSQELENKVKETQARVEKKVESNEDITEIISSEDDENLTQKPIDIKRKNSVVEISSDEGSDENQAEQKSSTECSEILPVTGDLTTAKDKPLENGEVDAPVSNTVQATKEVNGSKTLADSVQIADKAKLTEKEVIELSENEVVEASDSEVIEASDSEVVEISESEVLEVSESEVAEVLETESEVEKSIASTESKGDKSEEIVEETKITEEIASEAMSVDQSPVNADDTMEVDEEEKMDVDMTETISENDEEMTVVADEKEETKISEERTVVELEATIVDETIVAKETEEVLKATSCEAEKNRSTVAEEAVTETVPVDVKQAEMETEKETKIRDKVEVVTSTENLVSPIVDSITTQLEKQPTHEKKFVASDSLKSTSEKLAPKIDLESKSTSGKLAPKDYPEPKSTPEKFALKANPESTSAPKADPVSRTTATELAPIVDTVSKSSPEKLAPVSDLEPKLTPENLSPKADSASKSTTIKLAPTDDTSNLTPEELAPEDNFESQSITKNMPLKADLKSKLNLEKIVSKADSETKSNREKLTTDNLAPKTSPELNSIPAETNLDGNTKSESLSTKKPDVDAVIEVITLDKKSENVAEKSNKGDCKSDIQAEKSSANLSDSTVSMNSMSEELILKSTDSETENMSKFPETRAENKLLVNMMKHGSSVTSLNSSPVGSASAANVFNSTPIQKQFEISSENVSKISEVNEEGSGTAEAALSKTDEESTEVLTTSTSETDNQTSDSVTKYLNLLKQYNGMTAEEKDTPPKTTSKTPHQADNDIFPSDHTSEQYVVNDYSDKRGVRFMTVERLETKKSIHASLETASGTDSSLKLSSNGSVSSLPLFTLPNRVSEMSSSSGSQKTIDEKSFPGHIKQNQHTVTGIADLLEHLTKIIDPLNKIQKKFEPSTESLAKYAPTTPKSKVQDSNNKGKSTSPQATEVATPTKKVDKRTLKRTLNKSHSDDDEEIKSKSAKQSKTSQPKLHGTPSKAADSIESSVLGYCVLAKWIDKKYYAGKVTDAKIGNKFVILFEDGASKVLPKDSIVFGEEDILPLKDQTVYALVDDDYESGVVKTVEKNDDDKVIYTVEIEGKDINVSASDIYLTDQQAKAIQRRDEDGNIHTLTKNTDSSTEKSPGTSSRSTRNKRPPTSPLTPEAGFSGGVTKRGRRQKRDVQQTRISESSDISDSPEAAPPNSPDSALEAIEGVQPELQKTSKESEVSKMMIISDYMKQEPSCDIMALLGSLPTSKTLFKNKIFLLTCTLGHELPPINNAPKMNNSNEIFSLTNKTQAFSTIPFIKMQLQKQIEEGGGKVYNHFEDVPRNKYKQCKLIASRPCTTAKYVQCLAADMQAISHEWVIESCNKNTLCDVKKYLLPSGWSITNETYVRWAIGKTTDNRQGNKPFLKEIVLMASDHEDFVTFWSRVCKLAGATLRYIKSLSDITSTTTGYMVTEQDFPQVIKSKAEHYRIPIVSTLWIVQSLILGKVCDPQSHGKFTQIIFQDDDL